MKKSFFFLFAVMLTALSFQSCVKDSCEQMTTWVETTAIFRTQAEIDAISPVSEAARTLQNPGKLYFYNDFIFINEVREGIHIIDNRDPHNPVNTGFIKLEGNADIAIKDGRLYADCYMDLFVLDVTDVNNVQVIERQKDAFERGWDNGEGGIFVYNEQEMKTEVLDCEVRNSMINRGGIFFADDFALANAEADFSFGGGGGGTGTGGSMARFSLINDHLYSVGQSTMRVFSLNNPDAPALLSTVDIGWGIETIFPHEDKLFIGSVSGMQIWDNSEPSAPFFLSEFRHARACDPVFVKDNYAYVTLRDGSFCQGFNNQLDLIDITDLTNPRLEQTFPMDNPHGLSIDDNTLFICEGEHGLKSFDISDPTKLDRNKLDHVKDIFAYDVIAMPGESDILLMIGEDGFFQYDYSDPDRLTEISRIPVE